MDKHLLTALKATASAAFNKLPNQLAKIYQLKINDLQSQFALTIRAEKIFGCFDNSSFVHNIARLHESIDK